MREKVWRKILILVCVVVLVCGMTELGLFFCYPALFDGQFTRQDLRSQLHKNQEERQDSLSGVVADHRNPDHVRNKVLHPYLGFVSKPDDDQDWHGFHGFNDGATLQKRQPGKLIVAISGGSFAQGFVSDSSQELVEGLKRVPRFAGKQVEIVGLAMGGYKQPQQLMTLSYLLSLGAEFDLLINIDGFNEIALPLVENYFYGVSLAYPRLWKLYAQKSLDPQALDLLADINHVRRSREAYSGFFGRFAWSNTGLVVWKIIDAKAERKNSRLNEALSRNLSENRSYQTSGPFRLYDGDLAVLEESAHIWMRSSRQMKALCEANAIEYFHVLQPNQYVPESKPMSREERLTAVEEGPFIYRDIVVSGYPLLRERGEQMQSMGVSFHDFTMIYQDIALPLYTDKLCHVNKAGNDLVMLNLLGILRQEGDHLSAAGEVAGL